MLLSKPTENLTKPSESPISFCTSAGISEEVLCSEQLKDCKKIIRNSKVTYSGLLHCIHNLLVFLPIQRKVIGNPSEEKRICTPRATFRSNKKCIVCFCI